MVQEWCKDPAHEQQALARAAGVSKSTISFITVHNKLPGEDAWSMLASALGVGLQEIVDRALSDRRFAEDMDHERRLAAAVASLRQDGIVVPAVARDALLRNLQRKRREPTSKELRTELRDLVAQHEAGSLFDSRTEPKI